MCVTASQEVKLAYVFCPKCGKEIDHLRYYAYELQKADFYVLDTNTEYSGWDSLADISGEPDYDCPECGETLFNDEEQAERFLKRRPADYKYCVDCDIGFDLWKYESVENAGHTGCRLRDLTLEEFKEALKLCFKTGCFSDD